MQGANSTSAPTALLGKPRLLHDIIYKVYPQVPLTLYYI